MITRSLTLIFLLAAFKIVTVVRARPRHVISQSKSKFNKNVYLTVFIYEYVLKKKLSLN